jgi:hypothetical protein
MGRICDSRGIWSIPVAVQPPSETLIAELRSIEERFGIGQLRVGDRVTIEYNPDAPKYRIPGSAKKLLLLDMKSIAFIGVFLVFAAAYFEFNIRKSSRKLRTE